MPVTTVRKENDGFVTVAANSHVHYFLTAQGAQPQFSMGCEHHEDIERADQFPGHPMQNYDWTVMHPSLHAAGDNYTVAMAYLVTLNYTLKIEHHRQDHSVINVISDKDYASQQTDDFDLEILKIFKG